MNWIAYIWTLFILFLSFYIFIRLPILILIIIVLILIIFAITVVVIAFAIADIIFLFSMLLTFIILDFLILFYLFLYRIFKVCNKNTETVSLFFMRTLNSVGLTYSSDNFLLKWYCYILPLIIIFFYSVSIFQFKIFFIIIMSLDYVHFCLQFYFTLKKLLKRKENKYLWC